MKILLFTILIFCGLSCSLAAQSPFNVKKDSNSFGLNLKSFNVEPLNSKYPEFQNIKDSINTKDKRQLAESKYSMPIFQPEGYFNMPIYELDKNEKHFLNIIKPKNE